uniref:CSON006205 protein n=1 Tax=Culicoides sonorensis TaxID=179676 RepID=A0A336MSR4_CULSO
MTQEINIVLTRNGNNYEHSSIVSSEDLDRLEIDREKQKISGKDACTLSSECKSCNDLIVVNVYWYEDETVQKYLKQVEVCLDPIPIVNVKDEPLSESDSDASNNEYSQDDASQSTIETKCIKKQKIETHDIEYTHYPGIDYLLPVGLTIPSIENIKPPYFEEVKQNDGSVIYVEKKRKKCPVRVTNYDPRSKICDICGHEVPNLEVMTAHRRGHMFFKYTDVNCAGCGFYAGPDPSIKLCHSLFCTKKDNIQGLVCTECDFKAQDYKKLRHHMKKKHRGYNPMPDTNRNNEVECDLCGAVSVDQYALNYHQKYKCPMLETHNTRIKDRIDEYLKMLDLPSTVELPNVYKIKGKHSKMYDQKDGTKVFVSRGMNYLEIMNFDPRRERCELCGKSHMLKKSEVVEHRLKAHFFPNEHDTTCPGCGKLCRTDEEKLAHSHFCTKKDKIRVNYCEKCEIQYPRYSVYAKHLMRIHDGEGLVRHFMCHFCSATYDTARELQRHVIRHTDPRPFKCNHCKEDYKGKLGLQEHLVKIHFPHEAKHICNICDPPVLFSVHKTYKSHLNIVHLNPKERESCRICGIFIRKAGMETHIMRQHTEHSKKEKFPCLVCGKVFASRNNVNSHSKSHLPEHERQYKCKFCERRFNKQSTCIEHERFHTGEKPFKCETCGKAYARSQTLKDHKREHTGEGYKCSVCARMFTDRGNFRHHMKQHENQLGIKLTLNNEDRRLIKLRVITEEQALRGQSN